MSQQRLMKKLRGKLSKLSKKIGYKVVEVPKIAKCYTDQQMLLSGQRDTVVFDIGAHIGTSVHVYKTQFPDAFITSFEPYTPTFDILKERTKHHSRVTLENIAIGNEAGELSFNANARSQTNSVLPVAEEAEAYWGKNLYELQEKIVVKAITLDGYVQEKGIKKIDILKIDTQGFEYEVLLGAANTLRSGTIKLVYCEVILASTYKGQHSIDEIIGLLRSYGYTVFNIYNLSNTKKGRLRQVDILFIQNDYLKVWEGVKNKV